MCLLTHILIEIIWYYNIIIVSSQIDLVAEGAGVVLLSGVQLDVHLKAGGVFEGLPAHLTEQSICRHVTLLVGSQVL